MNNLIKILDQFYHIPLSKMKVNQFYKFDVNKLRLILKVNRKLPLMQRKYDTLYISLNIYSSYNAKISLTTSHRSTSTISNVCTDIVLGTRPDNL